MKTSTAHARSGLSKYRTIVVSIALFIVFDLGVLVMNFYISSQITKDAIGVNLAGRQRMLSQRTAKTLLQLQNATQNSGDVEKPLEELRKTFNLFDGTLRSFNEGGQAVGGDGKPVILERVDDPAGRAAIEKAFAVWTPYREKLQPVLTGDVPARVAALPDVVSYALANNVQILDQMNFLTTALEHMASAKADRLRLIQVGGITLALMNFFVILFHFIRQLRESDAMAEAARRETQDILESVSEGLMLLDRDLKIGDQYSRSLETIFNRQNFGGCSFPEMLREVVPEKIYKEASDYLDILFKEHVNIKLVASLNPLGKVHAYFDYGQQSKYLAFQFSRVHNKDRKLFHLLVTVKDITAQVMLENELEQSQKQAEEKVNMMLGILHVEPPVLREFLDRADRSLREVNDTLKRYGSKRRARDDQYGQVLQDIFPIVHTLKGEAALLELALFVDKAHAFEDTISELRGRANVSGDDLLSLTVKLDKLMSDVQAVREMVERITSLKETFDPAPATTEAASVKLPKVASVAPAPLLASDEFQRLAQKLADDQGKQVSLAAHGFETLALVGEAAATLRDALVQLVRNAVVHGIEVPQERTRAGKAAAGTVRLHAKAAADGYEIICHDDGRGLDAERLRAAALKSGRWSAEELSGWDEHRLRGLVFESGLSTAEAVTTAAGRGVGMDVVKRKVEALGGHLAFATQPGHYCAWRITLPGVLGLDQLGFKAA
ncbi:MAG TPA: type IV pili methyl-accepting chemotaxis transducer N-terminal domain-containing protein [Candidatus Competibacter sp.]|nr:hypothetical protein [Candidatus Competibacteraceae bacterium]HRC72019.1 type IV pili methyl-accepting chemotaxis transducer N-terminal domain-containing protein [Candidatus Competibacter sp.]